MRRIALALLVDHRNWLLLQERDQYAPWAPDQWSLVGGHVEADEDFEYAAYRELEEETGLRLPDGALHLWHAEETDGRDPIDWQRALHVYTAKVDFTDADIVVGEGRQIVFVDPACLAELDLADSARTLAEAFVRSDRYRSLSDQATVER